MADQWLVAMDLLKASDASGERIVEGLATVDVEDEQGETVVPDGLDLSYLRKHGALKDGHGKGAVHDIGRIVSYKRGKVRDIVPRHLWDRCRHLLNRAGLWIKSKLYKGVAAADHIWSVMRENPDHGYGFSLEGNVVQRDAARQGRLTRCSVRNVALTHNPVLADSFATLCKAFSDGDVAKTLGTGYALADQTGGQAMVPESLGHQVADPAWWRSRLRRFLNDVQSGEADLVDGTSPRFWAKRYGMDPSQAEHIAGFVKARAKTLFHKCFPERSSTVKCASCGGELEKALETGEVCPLCGVASQPESALDALAKALDEGPDAEDQEPGDGPSEPNTDPDPNADLDPDADLNKGLESEDDEAVLVDVTAFLKGFDGKLDGLSGGQEVLAKALAAERARGEALAKDLAARGEQIEKLAEQNEALAKDLAAVTEKLGLVSQVPQRRRGVPGKDVIEKELPGAGSDDPAAKRLANRRELNDPVVAQALHKAYAADRIDALLTRRMERGEVSPKKVLASIGVELPE